MYEEYPEIPISDLLTCAQNDIARGQTLGRYILCLRCNSTSIYSNPSTFQPSPSVLLMKIHLDNIYIAAIIINYQAASRDQLFEILTRLSDIDGFHEDSPVPEFICLEVFDPYEPDGKRRFGGCGIPHE